MRVYADYELNNWCSYNGLNCPWKHLHCMYNFILFSLLPKTPTYCKDVNINILYR
jgi:hypothetical protein